MKYIIAIDSGATKSEVLLFPLEKNGKSAARAIKVFPAINFNVLGFNETASRLIAIIKKSASKVKLANIGYICAGISGAGFAGDRRKLEKVIATKLRFKNIKILPDTETAFASIFESHEKNCGILIAGTGSVLYYRDGNSKIKKAGGWGRLFGDEGSGYWIAREALHKVTQHYDGRFKYAKLTKAIEKELGLSAQSIIKEIYHNNLEISKAAKAVFKSAATGDKSSKEIISSAAEKLCEHFIPIGNGKIKIALCGSLFSEEILLEKYLRKITKTKFPNVKFVKPQKSPVWGAMRMALDVLARSGAAHACLRQEAI